MITKEYLDTLIQKDKEKGLFRCKREMFTNKDLFDLEMNVRNLSQVPMDLMYISHVNFALVPGGRIHQAASFTPADTCVRTSIPGHVAPTPAYLKLIEELAAHPERAEVFDDVVVATGVTPRDPKIPGQDHPKVLSYIDVLRHGKPVGERVAIIGAGGIGFDVAEFLTHGEHPSTTLDLPAWKAEWGITDPAEARGGLAPSGPRVTPPARQVTLLQRIGDGFNLRGVQVGGDLEKQRHAFAVLVGQLGLARRRQQRRGGHGNVLELRASDQAELLGPDQHAVSREPVDRGLPGLADAGEHRVHGVIGRHQGVAQCIDHVHPSTVTCRSQRGSAAVSGWFSRMESSSKRRQTASIREEISCILAVLLTNSFRFGCVGCATARCRALPPF